MQCSLKAHIAPWYCGAIFSTMVLLAYFVKLQQSDLRVSFSLDVVVVAFMNTEGPLVPFPMSYCPC